MIADTNGATTADGWYADTGSRPEQNEFARNVGRQRNFSDGFRRFRIWVRRGLRVGIGVVSIQFKVQF